MAEGAKIWTRTTEVAVCVGERAVAYVKREPGEGRCKVTPYARPTDTNPMAEGTIMIANLGEWDAFAAAVREAIVELEREPKAVERAADASLDEAPAAFLVDVLLTLDRSANELLREGWRPWRGYGSPPVAASQGARVEVVTRCGGVFRCSAAGGCRWEHVGDGGDILAYRLVS